MEKLYSFEKQLRENTTHYLSQKMGWGNMKICIKRTIDTLMNMAC